MTDSNLIRNKVNQNAHQLDILSAEDLIREWEGRTKKSFAQDVLSGAKAASNYVAPVLDAVIAAKLIKDLGFDGKVVTKTVKGKTYVIFKNLAGKRSIFTGTRYLANSAKVVDMAIGKAGVAKSVISGARLTIFLVVPLDILQYILNDQQTLFDLIGTVASDVIKVGVASAIAGLVGLKVAAITTIAAGPLIVAIGIGLAVGFGLEIIDKKFGVTDRLIQEIEQTYDGTFGAFGRAIRKLDSTLRWQSMNGVPVGKGIFY